MGDLGFRFCRLVFKVWVSGLVFRAGQINWKRTPLQTQGTLSGSTGMGGVCCLGFRVRGVGFKA